MSVVSAVAAALLGLVFVVAGAAKLAARKSWWRQARDLGVPMYLVLFVPWVELIVGALLVVQLGQPWPAIAALTLLVCFSILIARVLAAGKHPACACFGTWSAKPVDERTLARNGLLIALGVLALF